MQRPEGPHAQVLVIILNLLKKQQEVFGQLVSKPKIGGREERPFLIKEKWFFPVSHSFPFRCLTLYICYPLTFRPVTTLLLAAVYYANLKKLLQQSFGWDTSLQIKKSEKDGPQRFIEIQV